MSVNSMDSGHLNNGTGNVQREYRTTSRHKNKK